ncbi:MAG: hypothetical protein WC623_24170 [Pedobacter sp.]|uniref:hypothetical protein n=1 Tax=Pedobacter sp. TaxID=1411316 RepID=UPI00356A9421
MTVRILLEGLTVDGKQYGKGAIVENPSQRLIALTETDLREHGRVAEVVETEETEENAIFTNSIVGLGKYKNDNITWGELIKQNRQYVENLVKPASRVSEESKAQIQVLLG